MIALHRTLLALPLIMSLGCDTKTDAAGSKTAAVKPADAKPSTGKPAGKTDAKKPPAASPHGAAKPANPHAGMAAPAAMPKPTTPKGPARDVTPSGELAETALAEIKISVPKEWESAKPSSSMRLAQWTIPGPGGDGEMVVFRFPGGAGGVEANLTRWKGQFQAPEGKTIDDVAKTQVFTVGAFKITRLDVSGRFVAAVKPGEAAKHDSADYRMLAAIVEGVGDAFFLKGVGPKKTMDVWAEGFDKALQTTKKGS